MTKERIIDLMRENLIADNREGPADIDGYEEATEAILYEQAKELEGD